MLNLTYKPHFSSIYHPALFCSRGMTCKSILTDLLSSSISFLISWTRWKSFIARFCFSFHFFLWNQYRFIIESVKTIASRSLEFLSHLRQSLKAKNSAILFDPPLAFSSTRTFPRSSVTTQTISRRDKSNCELPEQPPSMYNLITDLYTRLFNFLLQGIKMVKDRLYRQRGLIPKWVFPTRSSAIAPSHSSSGSVTPTISRKANLILSPSKSPKSQAAVSRSKELIVHAVANLSTRQGISAKKVAMTWPSSLLIRVGHLIEKPFGDATRFYPHSSHQKVFTDYCSSPLGFPNTPSLTNAIIKSRITLVDNYASTK